MTLKERMERRNKFVADAQGIMKKASDEKRALTAEENAQFDALMDQADAEKRTIDSEHDQDTRRARVESASRELAESRGRQTDPADPARQGDSPPRAEERTLMIYGRTGPDGRYASREGRRIVLAAGSGEHRRAAPEYREAFNSFLGGERRALQTDLDTAGGFITAPEQFVAELLRDVDDEVYIRSRSRRFTTMAQTLGVPRRTSKLSSAVWGSEIGAPIADTALKFGKRALTPHYQTSQILVSNDLLRSALMDPEVIVREELTRDSNELEERAFLTGSGSLQPLGVFTASADGISTSRDVSLDNTTTAITADGLINATYALKQSYRSKAEWMFHRDAVRNIRKLKDSTGQYLWQQAIQAGQPDRLLNLPLVESEWVPSTFTTGLYVGILAAWSHYWIVDSLGIDIQRQGELFSQTNQTGFIVRRKLDGAPTIEEAFVRVKLA